MTVKRQCFYIPIDQFHPEHGYVPSLVTEGESGHRPLMGADELALPWYWGKSYEDACAVAERRNQESWGLSPEEVKEIIDSSITASIREDAAKAQAREDYNRKLGRRPDGSLIPRRFS